PECQLKTKEQLKKQREEFRTLLISANTEKMQSIKVLINTYVGHIVMHAQANQLVFGIVCGNQNIGLSQLTTFEQFEPVLREENIQLATNSQNHPTYRESLNKSFSQIEEEINPGETFLGRKKISKINLNPKKLSC
ncbi:MAG: hypothetical protein ACC656_06950, partial [Candidatus Heimdallarchaeota archaeon]